MNGATSDSGNVFLGFILLGVIFLIDILPGILASKRRHPQALAIWILTITLGWTVLGWIAALIWASTTPQHVIVEGASPGVGSPGVDPVAPVGGTKTCPYCAETIKREAIVCRFCGRDQPATEAPAAPMSDAELMAHYGIEHVDGQYRYQTYRYDRLSDAVAYAKQQEGRIGGGE